MVQNFPEIGKNLFQAVCDSLPDVLYTIDPHGIFSYINPGIEEFGYRPCDLIGKHIDTILHPDDAVAYSSSRVLAKYRNRMTGDSAAPRLFDERRTGNRKTKYLILRIIAGDGSGKIFHGEVFASGYYLKKASGEISFGGTIGIIRNATERLQSERKIKKLNLAIEQSPANVIITDEKGCVEYLNPGFTELTGYTLDDLVGRNPPCFELGENPAQSQIYQAVFSGNDWKGEIQSRKKNGESFWEAVSISPLLDEAGNTTNLLIIGQDITERKLLTPYFSSDVVKKIVAGGLENSLTGENLVASILFMDIRNFTGISETLEPALVADLLNRIFTAVMDLVFSHGGSVNKMIGDAILATFGCPVGTHRDAENAVECALAIRDTVAFLNHVKPDYLEKDIVIGIGIATGKVFAGNIGSYRRMEYTVIGDVVNIASRLQTLTRELNCEILIDNSTKLGLSDRFKTVRQSDKALRGKSNDIEIYSLEGYVEAVHDSSGIFFKK